ncbi:MAG: hypothetical protein H6964_06745 [Chromatiaceae bacterium]|nr:hypothetical protein [Chromatiaceae bacterium]
MQIVLHTRNYRAVLVCGLICAQIIAVVETASAAGGIIKCTSDTGQVSFSQTGCEHGTREALEVSNPKVGWINLKKVLSEYVTKPEKDANKRPDAKKSGSGKEGRVQQQKCWRARKSLARIARELKQGYKPARGEVLRLQRAEEEEYLALFCEKPLR